MGKRIVAFHEAMYPTEYYSHWLKRVSKDLEKSGWKIIWETIETVKMRYIAFFENDAHDYEIMIYS